MILGLGIRENSLVYYCFTDTNSPSRPSDAAASTHEMDVNEARAEEDAGSEIDSSKVKTASSITVLQMLIFHFRLAT